MNPREAVSMCARGNLKPPLSSSDDLLRARTLSAEEGMRRHGYPPRRRQQQICHQLLGQRVSEGAERGCAVRLPGQLDLELSLVVLHLKLELHSDLVRHLRD